MSRLLLCTLLLARRAEAGSNPLSYTPFWHETSHEFVTVVKKNGALQQEPLKPGLVFTPYALFGETYTPVKVIPDTDCYAPILAKTRDHIEYKIGVCVTNMVEAVHVVEVVGKLGFDYDTVALRIQAENAIKEVLMTFTWQDIEKHKSNQLNEEIGKKIGQELVEKYGPVGGRIIILGVTIREKACQSQQLTKELANQAQNQAQTATELLARERAQAREETETAKVRAQEERAELVRKAAADRELAAMKATNERQELKNQQALRNAENAAAVSRAAAEAALEAQLNVAKMVQAYPEYAAHERARAYTEALGKSGSKFVLADGINSQMQGSITGGGMWSWLFGGTPGGSSPAVAPPGAPQCQTGAASAAEEEAPPVP